MLKNRLIFQPICHVSGKALFCHAFVGCHQALEARVRARAGPRSCVRALWQRSPRHFEQDWDFGQQSLLGLERQVQSWGKYFLFNSIVFWISKILFPFVFLLTQLYLFRMLRWIEFTSPTTFQWLATKKLPKSRPDRQRWKEHPESVTRVRSPPRPQLPGQF